MELHIQMDRGNAAFCGDEEDGDMDGQAKYDETARIVRGIADKIADGWEEGRCIDYNGNTVGKWFISLSAQEQQQEP